jgi:hypothetical protein
MEQAAVALEAIGGSIVVLDHFKGLRTLASVANQLRGCTETAQAASGM